MQSINPSDWQALSISRMISHMKTRAEPSISFNGGSVVWKESLATRKTALGLDYFRYLWISTGKWMVIGGLLGLFPQLLGIVTGHRRSTGYVGVLVILSEAAVFGVCRLLQEFLPRIVQVSRSEVLARFAIYSWKRIAFIATTCISVQEASGSVSRLEIGDSDCGQQGLIVGCPLPPAALIDQLRAFIPAERFCKVQNNGDRLL